MKELAIFYRDRESPEAINYIQDNFYCVFGDYVNITNYYTNEMKKDEMVDADAYIVCYEEMLQHLIGHILDFSKVVVMKRSIHQKYLQPILNIPAGSQVLVVNDSKESILQTIYMIYELGVGHIKLIPFEPKIAAVNGYANIDTAIVSRASEKLVPTHIKKVCNIHNREISFETFHKLISILELKSTYVDSHLLQKVKEDLDTNADYVNSYLSNFLKDQMLSNIVDYSPHALILLDHRNKIHYTNETADNLFHLSPGQILNQNTILPENLAASPAFNDEMVVYHDNIYLVQKTNFAMSNAQIGCCLVFKPEKELRDRENNLSRQLVQSGFRAKYSFDDIIHDSAPMKQCIHLAKKVSDSGYTLLICGESGTGKELMAQSIHNFSSRKREPFVAVNCANISEHLLESELFGYEEGAFTGAQKGGKIGLFEHANHGTIFLDEIGDIPLTLQTRLLRVLQEKQIMRVGGKKIIDIDVRILAATNVNLEEQVANGKFREDLYYRLNVISINIAPLRDRQEDILPILKVFLGKDYNELLLSERQLLLQHKWPGNVRELENVASYYRIMKQLPDQFYKHEMRGFPNSDFTSSSVHAPDETVSFRPVLEDHFIRILSIIAENTSPLRGIGRGFLLNKLAENGIQIGEGVLKKLLTQYHEKGYIEVRSGRAGSRITAKGLAFLQSKIGSSAKEE